ncbi:MAG: hypothetical protein WCJ54_03300 [Actinomycetota bacterium]
MPEIDQGKQLETTDLSEAKENTAGIRYTIIITVVIAILLTCVAIVTWYGIYQYRAVKNSENSVVQKDSTILKQNQITQNPVVDKNVSGFINIQADLGSGLTAEGTVLSDDRTYRLDIQKGKSVNSNDQFDYNFTITEVSKDYVIVNSSKSFMAISDVEVDGLSFRVYLNGEKVKINSGTMDGNAMYTFQFLEFE